VNRDDHRKVLWVYQSNSRVYKNIIPGLAMQIAAMDKASLARNKVLLPATPGKREDHVIAATSGRIAGMSVLKDSETKVKVMHTSHLKLEDYKPVRESPAL